MPIYIEPGNFFNTNEINICYFPCKGEREKNIYMSMRAGNFEQFLFSFIILIINKIKQFFSALRTTLFSKNFYYKNLKIKIYIIFLM